MLVAALGNPRMVQRGLSPHRCGRALWRGRSRPGRCWGWKRKESHQALILAASGSCGLMRSFDEGTTQPLHVSHAVRAGVIAALMAQGGAKGNPAIFETGFLPAYIGGACNRPAKRISRPRPMKNGPWSKVT